MLGPRRASDGRDGRHSLATTIREQRYESGPRAGQRVFGPLAALGYMVFVLLYVPCMATLATMRRESGSWKWPALSAVFSIGLAWIAWKLHRRAPVLAGDPS